MATMTKPKVEVDLSEQIEQIEGQIAQAERAEQEREAEWSKVAGLAVLSEANSDQVAEASDAWSKAQRETAGLRSALRVLLDRQTAQHVQDRAKQVEGWRAESDSAHSAYQAATSRADTLARDLEEALADQDAEAAIMVEIHSRLVGADPALAAEIDQEGRAAIDRIGNDHARQRAEVHEAAQRARYELQHTDGTDPTLSMPLRLLEDQVAEAGIRHSVALAAVTEWVVDRLARLADAQRDAQEVAMAEHRQRVHHAGLGHLPSPMKVRLDPAAIAKLLPEATRAALANLPDWLPASAHEGIRASRATPKSSYEARLNDQILQAGRKAIEVLTSPN